MSRNVFVAALALGLCACFEYSPHVIPQDEHDRDVNRKSLARLLATPPPPVLKFALLSDTHIHYDETERIVELVNAESDIAFVVHTGDLTHHGTAIEYRTMHTVLRHLRMPYLVVIGNHDYLSDGRQVYEHMFGARDFAFTYGRTRFVMFDSNSVEYGMDGRIPNLDFVRAALAPREEYDRAILFAHIDPSSEWDPALREPYYALVREEGIRISFYGHGHDPREFEQDGSRFVLVGAPSRRTYVVVTVPAVGEVQYERRFF